MILCVLMHVLDDWRMTDQLFFIAYDGVAAIDSIGRALDRRNRRDGSWMVMLERGCFDAFLT